jgi:hypothetical protein
MTMRATLAVLMCLAWDFQHFIPNYEVGRPYTLVMRSLYLPYESP